MTGQETPRTDADALIAEAWNRLTISRLGHSMGCETERDLIVIGKLAEYVGGLREEIVRLNHELEAESAALVDQGEAWWSRFESIRAVVNMFDEEITPDAMKILNRVFDEIVNELEGN